MTRRQETFAASAIECDITKDLARKINLLSFGLRQIAPQLTSVFAFLFLALFATTIRAEETPVERSSPQGMSLRDAFALGLIEGMTEYLPVSSTGHLLIYQHWMGRDEKAAETEAADAMAICIQSGAILAVIVLYFGRLQQIVRGLLGGDPAGLRLFINLIIAFLPAAVIGLLFHKLIKQHLFGIRSVTIAVFVGALLILAMPRSKKTEGQIGEKDLTDLKWWEAAVIGLLQCVAFWPGFSRSLATILACRAVKLSMSAAVEFSFLLGLITLSAATAKEGLSHGSKIIEHYGIISPALALIVAFVSAVISVKFMVSILNRFGLSPFGYYRLLLAAFCLSLWK